MSNSQAIEKTKLSGQALGSEKSPSSSNKTKSYAPRVEVLNPTGTDVLGGGERRPKSGR